MGWPAASSHALEHRAVLHPDSTLGLDQLRERLSINWTRRQSEVGVLWVKLDARLREQLGPEALQRFYGFDAQLEEQEFPDLKAMFYAQPAPAEGARKE